MNSFNVKLVYFMQGYSVGVSKALFHIFLYENILASNAQPLLA